MLLKAVAGNSCLTISKKEVKISAFKMVERTSVFTSQLKAMIVRNILLKKREKRKTLAEVLLPLYFLGILILIKLVIPNPNLPVIDTPRGEAKVFEYFNKFKNHTVAVVPNGTEAQAFMENVNDLWLTMRKDPGLHRISFIYFETPEELTRAYWAEPNSIPIAVVFTSDPMVQGHLEYEIRTNPSFTVTPPTGTLFVSPAVCRQGTGHWSGVFPIETGDSCPVNQYYYSGFVAIQTLLDYTKIRLDSDRKDVEVPELFLELFPKGAYTGGWMVAFRVVIPLYMVMALSQFITYLLILIVGEKEKKIKEGMKIMGLRDSVFWLSWFIIYGIFVLILTIITTILLFTLQVFQHTNFVLVFLLILLYGLSVIMFGFMITPFFDKSRTAGILGNFAVNIMSLLYFIQVFINDSSSSAFWFVSLISSSGFALAMDKALVLDLSGEGVNFDNLWDGPGIPFGGSLIMMALDIVLYGFLAYYLDCVIPSEHGTKRKPWFCFSPSFWCSRKVAPRHNLKPTIPDARTKLNGDFASLNPTSGLDTGDGGEEERVGLSVSDGGGSDGDVEQVPREMKGKEAIQIVDLHKTFHACRKPEVKAVNGINLTIYEGQITAILGHNGAGKTTLFNILTGLTAPTSGTAFVFGYDIRDQNDMSTIRRMTGVCPQHDILFDFLTPREHLEFFAAVRGIPSSSIDQEVFKTLQDIDLLDKANTFAKYLSGGQKRKLSVGIAVIGDPKIIILDEPTAGVDPYSRRHMWSVLQNKRHGRVILLTTHFMDEADILADRKAVVSKGRLRCCGSSLFLKNKFGIGYHLTLVLDVNGREHSITRLVTMHVGKAEKARRHGRELSFILPHDSVDSFAGLFSAIEDDINSQGRLGISSYGVSMTTLEEVFLHLEKEEETDETMDNLSKKMVRSRALSRSLSLQSRTSYQSLQEDMGVVGLGATGSSTAPSGTFNDGLNSNAGSSLQSGTTQQITRSTRSGVSEAVAAERAGMVSVLERISQNDGSMSKGKNLWQSMRALLWLRLLRIGRDVQSLYLSIALPLGFTVLGLYLNRIQVGNFRMKPLVLNGETYQEATRLAIHNGTDHQLDAFISSISAQIHGRPLSPYNGNFSHLLSMWPHLGALDISVFDVTIANISSIIQGYIDGQESNFISMTAIYNDTAQHSLPILINIINNAVYRMVVNPEDRGFYPLIVKTHPFQMTSQPAEFNSGSFSSSFFIGMIYVLVPISLAVDMVYDREVKARNQLRVNGLSSAIYFIIYFVVLGTIMFFVCVLLLVLIPVLDPPAFRPTPAFCTLGALCFLCCPASVLSAAAASYLFDRADSAQSILPNVAMVLGLAPFILVAALDMLHIGVGGDSGDERNSVVFGLHVFLSLVNPMYVPYAVVYFVNRVYVSCEVNAACGALTFSDYATDEILVLLVSTIFHAPISFILLVMLDIRKAGGKVSEIFKMFSYSKIEKTNEEIIENNDIGIHEDEDVKAERQKVAHLMSSNVVQPPVVILQNLRKEYQKSALGLFGSANCENCVKSNCCGEGNGGENTAEGNPDADVSHTKKVAVRNLSLAVDAGEVFGLLGHNGAGKTTTMKIIIAEEAPTRGRVQIGGHNITSNINEAFQLMGYCPQHDALWKNITVREHLELYAAIRGVPQVDIPIVVDAYLTGLQIHEHANKQSSQCSGGTRRKLSYAMAMVGGPRVVLMDEPSTGMDPRSKRFLWDTILASFQGTRGAILTTHSMEEADALCSRVGIMVQGELRCLGSTQHLKNLYGAGYTLEMKVRGGDSTPTASAADRQAGLRAFVSSLFPDATLEESFADRLVFCVPQHAVTSLAQCFLQLERAKLELDIEEYSFSQTTLEQVFLKFAHYNEVNDD